MRVCAIHQPNFFPWLGFFDKIRRADVFVFLDQVHYPKSGSSMSSWCNRVRVMVNRAPHWMSCPVVREHGAQIIDTVRINNARPWRDDIRRTLEASYRRAPNFADTFALVERLLAYETDSLAEFNINAIRTLSDRFGCTPQWIRQSELAPMNEMATERLVGICRAVGADVYLSGDGSADYLDAPAFDRTGIELRYQNFIEPPYGDVARFIPGLSVIDRLMQAPA